MLYRSYVLKDSTEDDDALVRRIHSLLEGSPLGRGFVQTTDEDLGNVIWVDKSAHPREIRLASESGGRYVTVGAADEGEGKRLAQLLATILAFYGMPELIEKARACGASDAQWLTLMAAGLNREKHPGAQEVVELALHHPEVRVRRNGALAAGVLRWLEMRPALETALAAERDGQNRTVLAFVLDQLRQMHASKGRR